MLSFKKMKVAIDIAIKSGSVPNIVGLQGIGKSDLVREYARENGYAFEEITCSLLQEGDLAMPYILNKPNGATEVSYSINNIITRLCEKSKTSKYAILFLDEFNRPSSQVQSELMNLVLQREILGYKLADNVRIILAMNPSSEMEGYEGSDYTVSFSDAAIMGRVVSLNLNPSVIDWLEYGSRIVNGRTLVHESVLDFLRVNGKMFTTKEETGKINATPRGWKRVSDIVCTYEETGCRDINILKNLISGTMDSSISKAFVKFYEEVKSSDLDYSKLAISYLQGNKFDLKNYSSVEITDIFDRMVEFVQGNYDETYVNNLAEYILSAPRELSFSLSEKVEKLSPEIYSSMLMNDKFSSYILGILNGVQTIVSRSSSLKRKGA